jgi:hypothetical protein
LEDLVAFIEKSGQAPVNKSKNKAEASLASWLCTQKMNCKANPRRNAMADDDKFARWTETLQQHPCLLVLDLDAIWATKLAELVAFVEKSETVPIQRSKDKFEASLASWLCTQKKNCKANPRRNAMADDDKFARWTETLQQHPCLLVCDLDAIWATKLTELVAFIGDNKRVPIQKSKDKSEASLASWLCTQKMNSKAVPRKYAMADETKFARWTETLRQHPCLCDLDLDAKWTASLDALIAFVKKHKRAPANKAKGKEEASLAGWVGTQKQNCKAVPRKKAMADETKFARWSATVLRFSPLLGPVRQDQQSGAGAGLVTEETQQPAKKQKRTNEAPKKKGTKRKADEQKEEDCETRQKRRLGEFSVLNQRYTIANTAELHKEFAANRTDWDHYHALNTERNALYAAEDISYNLVIARMNLIQTSRRKRVLDLGCGLGQIGLHFKDDPRFDVRGYDHVATDESVTVCDITALPDADASAEVAVLSLALWGSHCRDALKEAHRVLESGGVLYVVEGTRRWSTKGDDEPTADRLEKAIVTAGFTVKSKTVNRFAVFECVK